MSDKEVVMQFNLPWQRGDLTIVDGALMDKVYEMVRVLMIRQGIEKMRPGATRRELILSTQQPCVVLGLTRLFGHDVLYRDMVDPIIINHYFD